MTHFRCPNCKCTQAKKKKKKKTNVGGIIVFCSRLCQDIYDGNDYSSNTKCRFWIHALWENQCCSLNLVMKLTRHSLYKLRTTIPVAMNAKMILKLCSESFPLIV